MMVEGSVSDGDGGDDDGGGGDDGVILVVVMVVVTTVVATKTARPQGAACYEICTSRSTKCCTRHDICTSRFTKCCACASAARVLPKATSRCQNPAFAQGWKPPSTSESEPHAAGRSAASEQIKTVFENQMFDLLLRRFRANEKCEKNLLELLLLGGALQSIAMASTLLPTAS